MYLYVPIHCALKYIRLAPDILGQSRAGGGGKAFKEEETGLPANKGMCGLEQ